MRRFRSLERRFGYLLSTEWDFSRAQTSIYDLANAVDKSLALEARSLPEPWPNSSFVFVPRTHYIAG